MALRSFGRGSNIHTAFTPSQQASQVIQNLHTQIQQKKVKILELERVIEQKSREKEGFAATLRVIKRELDEINQKKSKIIEEKNDLQQQADTLAQQRDQLNTKVETQKTDQGIQGSVQGRYDSVVKRLKQLEADLSTSHNNPSKERDIQLEIKKLNASKVHLKELEELVQQVRRMKAEGDKLQDKIDKLAEDTKQFTDKEKKKQNEVKELETNIAALDRTDLEPQKKELSLLQLEVDKHHQDLAQKKGEMDTEKQSFYQKQQSSVGRGVSHKPVAMTTSDKKPNARDSNVLNWYLKGSSPTSTSSNKDSSLENLVAYKKEVPKKDGAKSQKSNDKAAVTPVTATSAAPAAQIQVAKPFGEEITACEKMIKYLKKFNKANKKPKKSSKTESPEGETGEQTPAEEQQPVEEAKVVDVAISHNFEMLVLFERLSLVVPTSGSQVEATLQATQTRLDYFRKLSAKRSPASEAKEENGHTEQSTEEGKDVEEKQQEEERQAAEKKEQDEAAQKERQEAEEKQKREEEERQAAEKKKQGEEVEKQRQEEEKQKQEEERKKQDEEAEKQRQEAEKQRQEEERKKQDEEAEKQRQEAATAEKQRQEAEAAEKQRQEEEKQKQEAEQKKQQDEAADKQRQEEEARVQKEKEAEHKKQEEEEQQTQKQAETKKQEENKSSEVVANAPKFSFLFEHHYRNSLLARNPAPTSTKVESEEKKPAQPKQKKAKENKTENNNNKVDNANKKQDNSSAAPSFSFLSEYHYRHKLMQQPSSTDASNTNTKKSKKNKTEETPAPVEIEEKTVTEEVVAPQPTETAAPQEETKPAATADDDFDVFGEMTEDEAAKKAENEKKAADEKAKKDAAKKAPVIGRSTIILDVKPWEADEEGSTKIMDEIDAACRSIQQEGLEWKAKEIIKIGFGITKLRIMANIVDDLVSVDGIIEQIQDKNEELVQSIDIFAFNKL
jgi:translation elongation factor EF-1beta